MRVTTGYIGVMGRATFQAKAVSWPIGRKKLCERRFIRRSMHGITFSSGGGEPGPAWIAQPNHPQIQEEKPAPTLSRCKTRKNLLPSAESFYSMIKFFVLDVLLGQVVAVSTDPAPD